MRRACQILAFLCCLAVPAGVFADEVLQSETLVEGEGGTAPAQKQDEFEKLERSTLTRVVRERQYKGIDVVVLEEPAESDGFGHISVDKDTELGRELVRLCPDGTLCTINAIITNGTLTRIYSIRQAKQR